MQRHLRWLGHGALALGLGLAAAACDDDETTAAADMMAAGGAGGGGGAGAAGGMGGAGGGGVAYDLALPGMEGPASIHIDGNGFLHVKCATNNDCFRVEGYYHAAHRFAQMDLRRRVVRGQLSAIVTNIALPIDTQNRGWFADPATGRELAEQLWAAATPETQAAVEAYGQGVNAWLAEFRAGDAELSDEYGYALIDRAAIRDWEPLDSAAAILALLDQLTNRTDLEIEIGALHADLPAGLASDLYGQRPASPSAILPHAQGQQKRGPLALDLDALQRRKARLEPYGHALAQAAAQRPARRPDEWGLGSNNWVVGSNKSATGNALLSNDPHLGISNPAIWYVVHLDAKTAGQGDLHVAGVSFAGLPGIIIGQNEQIAWGVTTTFFDAADVYLETLTADGDGVLFEGAEVPFVTADIEIAVSGSEPATIQPLFVPHHGPVLAIDREAGVAITGKWAGHDADTDLNYLVQMPKAGSVAQAREALKQLTTTGQNFVVADRTGGIGWFPYSRMPNRPWMSLELAPWLPLPGDGSAEWDGYMDYADLPQAVDPAAGYLATANNDMTGALWDGDPTNDGQMAIQGYTAVGKRHERIAELLDEIDSQHTRDTMERIVGDVRSNLGAEVVPAALAALGERELEAGAATVRDLLVGWDFQCPTGFDGVDPATATPSGDATVLAAARGCAAFHVFWFALREHTFGDELAAQGIRGDLGFAPPMVHQLVRPEVLSASYWDDVDTADVQETDGDIVARALDTTAARMTEWLGADSAQWLWGRLHQVTLVADLFSLLTPEFNHGPFLNDGGLYTVDVANPRYDAANGRFDHPSGASMRYTCEVKADTGPDCTIQVPGGQQHYRDSPHYDDLLQKWLVNEAVPLTTDWATIEAGAEASLTAGPPE
ncbi:MAG: penicillin acylase family protein [Myxococcales bacterium]|nr:penicillin acylase family protein [Myxococcales bacterium]